jgi:hypothetical protein
MTGVQACQGRGWSFISVAKKNRNFSPHGRGQEKRKLHPYGANVLRRRGQCQTVENKKHWVADRLGRLSKAGRVKLVFSRRCGERPKVCFDCPASRSYHNSCVRRCGRIPLSVCTAVRSKLPSLIRSEACSSCRGKFPVAADPQPGRDGPEHGKPIREGGYS